MGALHYLQFAEGMETLSIGLFTRMLEWSPKRVQLYFAGVWRGMEKEDAHMMFNKFIRVL